MNDKPSELSLERYVAGELSLVEAEMVEAAAADGQVKARIEAIRRSNEEILSAYPAAEMARRIEMRAGLAARGASPRLVKGGRPRTGGGPIQSGSRARLLWALPAAAVLVVGIGIALRAGGGFSLGKPGLEDARAKGGTPHISLFRKTASGAERLADGATAVASDLIQIGYYSGAKGYGAIFSIDGRGTLTFHLPAGYSGGARNAPEIEGSGEAVLPSAYELDDAPRFERFFFVFSAKPFGLAEIDRSARGLAANPLSVEAGRPGLPAGLSWSALSLKKGVQR